MIPESCKPSAGAAHPTVERVKTISWPTHQPYCAGTMQKSLRTTISSDRRLSNRHGFTALAVLMLSLGVGATTALFTLADAVMPNSAHAVRCETVMKISGDAPAFGIEAIAALPDAESTSSVRPMLALLGVLALGFLLVCMRGAAAMISSRRAMLVAVGTTIGALMVATLSLRALSLPAIGMRAVAFALCVSLVSVWFARVAQSRGSPLTI